MIHLHYSNRLEALVDPLAARVREAQTRDPLGGVTIVVPNRAVEEFLKLRLAELEGVAANLRFPFLGRYLAEVIGAAEGGLGVLDADALQVAAFECLRKALDAGSPELAPVRAYATADVEQHNVAERERRLFELSGRVARLIREYSISRRAMLKRWRISALLEDPRFTASERWQRHLYLAIFDHENSVRRDWMAHEGQRLMMLPDAWDAADRERLRAALAPELHVFGLAYAGPEFARIFAGLGELTELHVYALNPCLEFWEDVRGRRVAARERWARRGEKLGAGLEATGDPFALQAPEDNRALALWGRPGREYIRLLNELTDCVFDERFSYPIPDGRAGTLLERLQQHILLRAPEGSGALPATNDGTIRFLSCPSIRREVEIAASTIWALVGQDHDRQDCDSNRLRFHQIAVLVPDAARDAYLPHIESVFAGQHQIPVNIADLRLRAESRVAEAAELLLRLPRGRFSREELLHLLTHPAITGALPEADSERWTEYCRALGVYFGADERDLAATYIPRGLYHWDQGLRRLALGVFMGAEPGREARAFVGADGCEYLPYQTAQDESDSVAALLRVARGLIADARELRARMLTLGDWGRVLSGLIAAYIRPSDAAGEQVRQYVLDAIESMGAVELRSAPVPYEIAYAAAQARLAEAESARGRYAETGVIAGSLSALRALPRRAIFVLGLGEAVFPEREHRDLLDLRMARRRAGDVSPAERDRYLFLETILAARERIFFSYVGRDPLTGDKVEPSPLICELQDILSSYLGQDALSRLTAVHPASRYDRGYFPELASEAEQKDELGPSFDPSARRGAALAALRADLDAACGNERLPPGRDLLESLGLGAREKLEKQLRVELPPLEGAVPAAGTVLPIAALRRFLECPIQGAARYALGLAEEDEARDESEDEPLEQEFLGRLALVRDALWLGRGEWAEVERCYRDGFRASQLRGQAPAGPFAEAACEQGLRKLRRCIGDARAAGVCDLTGWQVIRIGGADEFRSVQCVLPAIVLDVPLKTAAGSRVCSVTIHGTVGPVSPGLDSSIRCVAGKQAKAKDFLEGFLWAVVLAAAGEQMPSSFTAIAGGGEEREQTSSTGKRTKKTSNGFTRTFRPPPAERAREYLSCLAEDLLSGNNHYFLPIEAVDAVQKTLRSGPSSPDAIASAVEKVRTNRGRWDSCSSDYGPVRNARRFEMPEPARVLQIIQRRYGPIMGIFAR